MTKPATYPVEATMGRDGRLSVRHSEPVTGSPQVTTELHAHYREVPPKQDGKTLTERFNESYDEEMKREDQEFADSARRHYNRWINTQE